MTVKKYANTFGLEHDNHILNARGKRVNGFWGMQEVAELLSDEYGWSDSVSNLSAKLQRESIRYKEVMELADVLGYDIVWKKRKDS